MDADLSSLIVFTILIDLIFLGLGLIIKTQNAGDMINGFDYDKYDLVKSSYVLGNGFIFIGASITFIMSLTFFLPVLSYNTLLTIQAVLLIVGLFATLLVFELKCKKPKI